MQTICELHSICKHPDPFAAARRGRPGSPPAHRGLAGRPRYAGAVLLYVAFALLGAARAAPATPVAAAPPAATPAPAAAPAGPEHAVPPPEPPLPGPPMPALGYEPAYVDRALVRGPVSRKDGAPSGVTWAVRTGTGHALGAAEFARVTGDPAGEERIHGRRKAAVWEGIVLAGIGTTLEGVALGFVAGGNTASSLGEDELWRGATFAIVGAFPIGLCTLPSRANKDRERWTGLYYTEAQVDPLIAKYNAGLRQQLGLAPLPAQGTAPAPGAAPTTTSPTTATPAQAPEDAPALPPADRIPDAEPAEPAGGGR